MKNLVLISLLMAMLTAQLTSCSNKPDFKTFPKIDAHIHLETSDDSFVSVLKENNLKMISIAYDASSRENINRQLQLSQALHDNHPSQIAFTTTFSMEGFANNNWQQNTIEQLHKDFQNGAIAVKVWKDIGMTFRNSDSSFIFMDDKRLDPIWDYIESQDITLVNHTAEPKNCWLPIDKMSTLDDSSYYIQNPQYHMFLHPDYPSYNQLLDARNRMLNKHPKLRFVACHFASLEWSVDEQAKFLDKYPNTVMDMASRICHLKYQETEKVRNFFIKYQDRLLYGTDNELTDTESDESTAEEMRRLIETTYFSDWEYFSTSENFTQIEKTKYYKGLKLPVEVLEKIYYKNARRIYKL